MPNEHSHGQSGNPGRSGEAHDPNRPLVPVLDENGNPVLDADGNPVMEKEGLGPRQGAGPGTHGGGGTMPNVDTTGGATEGQQSGTIGQTGGAPGSSGPGQQRGRNV